MYQSKAIFFLKAQLNLILQVYFACDTLNTELGVELQNFYLSIWVLPPLASTSEWAEAGKGRDNSWNLESDRCRGHQPSLCGKKKKQLSGKPPAEINALLYMFQSRFQIPFSCFYGFASIPVPIVTCLRGNSCVILAEADDWKQPQEQLASAKRTRSGQVISEPTSRSWSTSNPLC